MAVSQKALRALSAQLADRSHIISALERLQQTHATPPKTVERFEIS